MKTTVEFDTSPFFRSHCREPRGRGSWVFAPEPNLPATDPRLLWSPSMTYAEARRWARARLQAMGVTGHVVLYVES